MSFQTCVKIILANVIMGTEAIKHQKKKVIPYMVCVGCNTVRKRHLFAAVSDLFTKTLKGNNLF